MGALLFPATRRRFFLKEGVVHAMDQLAASAPKEEPAAPAPAPKEAAPPPPRAPHTRRSSSRLKVGSDFRGCRVLWAVTCLLWFKSEGSS